MNAKILFAAGAVSAATLQDNILTEADYKFMQFVSKQGRSYGTKAEFLFRSEIFKKNLAFVEAHNAKNLSWTLETNFLADRTDDEKKKMNGFHSVPNATKTYATFDNVDIPKEVDWRSTAVTPVQDQGQCGSSWAFPATGAIEGARQIAGHDLVQYSVQQLLDCSKKNNGCMGGQMAWAFDYVKDHPLATEAEYQYAAKDMQCDTTKESKGKGEIYSYKHVRPHSAFALRQALAQGPVASAIEADTAAFELYKGGIITSDCGTTIPNHGILIVGYGTQDEQSFFLLKNTWGTNWGEQGYVRVGATDKNNVCAMLKGYDVIPFAKK